MSELGEKYTQTKHCLHAKTVQNSCKQICWLNIDVEIRIEDSLFPLKEALFWIILARSDCLKLNRLNNGFVAFHIAFYFTRHQLMGWSGVDYL